MPLPLTSSSRRPGSALAPFVLAAVVLSGIVACDARAGGLPSLDSVTASRGPVDDGRGRLRRLDPDLREAFVRARADAAGDGVVLHLNSGWRSTAHQQRLFDEAVARYGSVEEAARWVARPGTSVHESGDAIDVGPEPAATWLADHGADHGLCRVYDNEPWHFELRPDAVGAGCPATYADPAADPRLQ
jgi:hypothetical protein